MYNEVYFKGVLHMDAVSVLLTLVSYVANWFIYKKLGREGWEGIIPFYNTYVMFEVIYDNGWKFLTLLIPFYNIYVACKLCIDLAHRFGKSTGFGWGLILLNPVFDCILAFSDAQDLYGATHVNPMNDLSRAFNFNSEAANAEALAKYKELLDSGVITQEEFDRKKEEIFR